MGVGTDDISWPGFSQYFLARRTQFAAAIRLLDILLETADGSLLVARIIRLRCV